MTVSTRTESRSAWETVALSKEKASSRLRGLREPELRRWPCPVRPPYALPAVILSGQWAPRPYQSLKTWNNHRPYEVSAVHPRKTKGILSLRGSPHSPAAVWCRTSVWTRTQGAAGATHSPTSKCLP